MFGKWFAYGMAALALGCGNLTVRAEEPKKDAAQYRAAAEKGDAEAQFSLGVCYYNGESVAKDLEKAKEWFEKAAEQGVAEAQFSLGLCYDNEWGVAKDLEQAMYWIRKAAERGDKGAQRALKELGR